jgi:hypothetical protein
MATGTVKIIPRSDSNRRPRTSLLARSKASNSWHGRAPRSERRRRRKRRQGALREIAEWSAPQAASSSMSCLALPEQLAHDHRLDKPITFCSAGSPERL